MIKAMQRRHGSELVITLNKYTYPQIFILRAASEASNGVHR